jgi:hypothetical protein
MGKFLLGLIVGIVVGVLAMTVNPNLPEELRALTVQVMRGAGEAADELGNAAEDLADEAEQPEAEPPAATPPAQPTEPATPSQPDATRPSQ